MPNNNTKRRRAAITRPFESIQHKAAYLIIGAFKTTTAAAFYVLHLIPI